MQLSTSAGSTVDYTLLSVRPGSRLPRLQRLPPAMIADAMSLCSSQGSEERSLVLPLILTTFAGEEIQLAIDLQEYDRLHEFENAVLEQLRYLGDSSTFGCELQFVHKDTRKVLADPIWSTLRDNHCFYVVARQCFVDALAAAEP